MKTEHLNILDLMNEHTPIDIKNEWISRTRQQDIYEIASWLMMYLTKHTHQIEHKRSQIRSILAYYYDRRHLGEPWTPKQKYYVGYAIINLWPYRQMDQDPRFNYDLF